MVLCVEEKKLLVIDSLPSATGASRATHIATLRKYFDACGMPCPAATHGQKIVQVPKQSNSHDCGLFTILYMARILNLPPDADLQVLLEDIQANPVKQQEVTVYRRHLQDVLEKHIPQKTKKIDLHKEPAEIHVSDEESKEEVLLGGIKAVETQTQLQALIALIPELIIGNIGMAVKSNMLDKIQLVQSQEPINENEGQKFADWILQNPRNMEIIKRKFLQDPSTNSEIELLPEELPWDLAPCKRPKGWKSNISVAYHAIKRSLRKSVLNHIKTEPDNTKLFFRVLWGSKAKTPESKELQARNLEAMKLTLSERAVSWVTTERGAKRKGGPSDPGFEWHLLSTLETGFLFSHFCCQLVASRRSLYRRLLSSFALLLPSFLHPFRQD